MIVKEFIPESKLLNKYVKSIYFMCSKENRKTEFVYYPHYIETINIFLNSQVEISQDTFKVKKTLKQHAVIFTASKTKFRTAVIEGGYDIIGIQLYPLGIYNFLDVNTFSKIENGIYEVNNPELLGLIDIKNSDDRLKHIENIFINIFKANNQAKLQKIIQLIHESKGRVKMNELEHRFSLSRRTILRQFKKFLHCSFEDYKNTTRFRLTIENYYSKNNSTSDMIGDVAFYDQSDFINHFKALSGESPQKLLKQISSNPKSTNYFWRLK